MKTRLKRKQTSVREETLAEKEQGEAGNKQTKALAQSGVAVDEHSSGHHSPKGCKNGSQVSIRKVWGDVIDKQIGSVRAWDEDECTLPDEVGCRNHHSKSNHATWLKEEGQKESESEREKDEKQKHTVTRTRAGATHVGVRLLHELGLAGVRWVPADIPAHHVV